MAGRVREVTGVTGVTGVRLYLWISDEGTRLTGVRQLALALLTLSREGCRSLGGATAQHAIQWRRR